MVTELEVVSVVLQLHEFSGSVHGLEPQPVALLAISVLEVQHGGVVSPLPEGMVLRHVGDNHGVCSGHHEHLLGQRGQVGLLSGVLGLFLVVHVCQPGRLLELLILVVHVLPLVREGDACALLEEFPEGTDHLLEHVVGASAHAAMGAADANEGLHGRVVLLLDVAPHHQVALAHAHCVETVFELGVFGDFVFELLHLLGQSSRDGSRAVGHVRAHRVDAGLLLSHGIAQRLHARVGATVAHPVQKHHWGSCGTVQVLQRGECLLLVLHLQGTQIHFLNRSL